MNDGLSTREWKQELRDKFTKHQHGGITPNPEPSEAHRTINGMAMSGPIVMGGKELPLSIAAHHVIPGKASLPKSELAKYIWAAATEAGL